MNEEQTWFGGKVKHISNSSINMLEACPRRWAETYILGKREPQGEMAAIGSANHSIIQNFLSGKPYDGPEWNVIKDQTERNNLIEYLQLVADDPKDVENAHLNDHKGCTIAVEQEFKIKFREDAPPVLGFIDQKKVIDPVSILVRDHKTNRRAESRSEWQKKLQPRLYAWAERQKNPHIELVIFSIGYINQENKFLEWEIPKSEDEKTLARLNSAWEKMVAYYAEYEKTGNIESFPEVMTSDCKWCNLKATCQTFQTTIVKFETPAFLEKHESLPERYEAIKTIAGITASFLKETEALMEKEIEAKGGTLVHKEKTYTMGFGNSRRSVDFSKFWAAVSDANQRTVPGCLNTVMAKADDLFSIGVGEVDKFLKMNPELAPYVMPVIEKNPPKTKKILVT
jgi:hypothetical protein